MTKRFLLFFIILFSGSAFAGAPSISGGKTMNSGTAHHTGVGWPSLFYEWWHGGSPDWAIGGELVYGDWSGAYSNVEIGLGINVPLRWQINQSGRTHVAFRLDPGILIASAKGPQFTGTPVPTGADRFVFGVRGEMGVPVTVEVHPMVNIITGGTLPVSVFFVEDVDPFVVLPIFVRMGVEVEVVKNITPWFLMELGPAIAIGDFGSDVDFAIRAWVGSSFF